MPERDGAATMAMSSTVIGEVERASEMLQRAGITDPHRRALQMWSAMAGTSPGETWMHRDRAVEDPQASRYREAVSRHAAGAPMAYAVGRAGFRTLDLMVDARVLIPRPETEGLVELVLERTRGAGGTAADLGTGSGCIALALAVEGDFQNVVATDRSPDALALAGENCERTRPAVAVELRRGDWLEPLAGRRCRAIVANPPYLCDEEWEMLDAAVREFEPREALASGPDGLEATRILLGQAIHALEPGGLLALEIDERRAAAVETLARDAGWRHVTIHQDLFGRPRYVLAVAREDS